MQMVAGVALLHALSQNTVADAQKEQSSQGLSHDPNGASERETVHLDTLHLAKQIILYVTFCNAHDPVPVQQRIYKKVYSFLTSTVKSDLDIVPLWGTGG